MRVHEARRALGAGWLALWALAAVVGPVLGAEPAATSGAGGDPRSPGEGPGLVGDPGFALGVVVLVGVVSVIGTLAYVRLTAARSRTGRG